MGLGYHRAERPAKRAERPDGGPDETRPDPMTTTPPAGILWQTEYCHPKRRPAQGSRREGLVIEMSEAATAARGARSPATPSLIADLITLTKPRIISLLLVTTIYAPMFIQHQPVSAPWSQIRLGRPRWLSHGRWRQRHQHVGSTRTSTTKVMVRTRLRPIPSGRMTAASVLLFEAHARRRLVRSSSGTSSTRSVPLPRPWRPQAFYVLGLHRHASSKRISPQNIVIGGAAGAFPPLVGWAAMTGSLSLGAAYLFAIIFYWTPPHFWALALNKQRDYGAAGIPMMPNVHGVHEDQAPDAHSTR